VRIHRTQGGEASGAVAVPDAMQLAWATWGKRERKSGGGFKLWPCRWLTILNLESEERTTVSISG
jgi:hypothetical protein